MSVDLSKIRLFRMMHVENIPHVMQYGITHASSPNANPQYLSIGDNSLISSRSQFIMANGKRLGTYIPFYFGERMPMLYVIQKGFNMVNALPTEKIVYCVTSVQKIIDHKLPFVFTNGHAVNELTEFFDIKDIGNIEQIIDEKAIKARYWKDDNDIDLKRRKEAEFLVEADIPLEAIAGWIVYNNDVKIQLHQWGIADKQTVAKPDFYF